MKMMTEVGMPMDKDTSNVSSGNNKTQQVVKNDNENDD